MLAYNNSDLQNLELQGIAEQANRSGFITEIEKLGIQKEYPVQFYSPNIFLRIGLGILTQVASAALLGLALLATDAHSPEILALLMAVISIIVLEWMIRNRHHYRSGVDDILLHSSIIYVLIYFGFKIEGPENLTQLILSIISLVLYSIAFSRYLDRLSVLLALASWGYFIYNLYTCFKQGPSQLLIFLLAASMISVFFLARGLQKKNKLAFYHRGLRLVEYAAVIGTYASLHYYTVEHLIFDMNFDSAGQQNSLSFSWFYWGWTFIVPLIFLLYGLKIKARPWIRIGIVLVIAFFFFLQVHENPVDHEIAAVLYGILLAAIAFGIIKYLKINNSEFTDQSIPGQSDLLFNEAFFIAAGLAGQIPQAQSPAGSDTRFGGGNFGGGGASGEF